MADFSNRDGARSQRVRWPLLFGIALAHLAGLYLLGKLLAPDFTGGIEREVIAAFSLETPPAPPPPPENEIEPDEGAQAAPGKEAVPQPVTAPEPEIALPTPSPVPQSSSTGAADRSGARASGDGTGAAGSGPGTGSGNRGGGRGGVAVTRPVHVSGRIDDARDYPVPPGGREVRRGSEVIVRVIVGTDGRARDCTIYRPSPDPEADAITCRLVEQRLGFRPAMDASGNPVPAPFYWRQRWF
ncbi:energy transducer TonB [Erythrobacter sp.]|jgi:protein TonB|uniref:energy transducer TonB n=1 Tax=Erythrobacter sp. TaxID=1042 RepID=UPI002EA37995|nr:energy transducer TonB [Erythrobacter sp.]